MYRLVETLEAKQDVKNLAAYMIYSLKNVEAANRFLYLYDRQVHNLKIFPYGHKGVNIEYQGYEIHLKTFSTYNMFYTIDDFEHQIVVLRVLKDRQNWRAILQTENQYNF